jgi:4-amino-4-deoxy-L-arabinose transferase-like glycosyltransferase
MLRPETLMSFHGLVQTLRGVLNGRSPSSASPLAWVGFAAVVLVALAATLALVSAGALDTRFASAFSGDEEFIGNGVSRMLTRPSLSYGFWWYPGFYMMLSATHALLLLASGVPMATAALLAPRMISALGYAATILTTGLLAHRLAGRARAAVFAAVWVATTPAFFEYGITAHPDTLQLATLSTSLWLLTVAVDRTDRRYLWGGAAVAGLAFVTKYAGAFLVPVLAGVAVYARVRHAAPEHRRQALKVALLQDCPRAAAAFLGATVLGAPQFWFNLKAYAIGVSTHSRNVSYGYFVRETASGWTWLEMLAEPELMGATLAALLVLALGVVAVIVVRAHRAGSSSSAASPLGGVSQGEPSPLCGASRPTTLPTPGPTLSAGHLAVLGFVVPYMGLLVSHSRMFEPRYLFPVVPALYALLAAALSGPAIGSRVKALGTTGCLALVLLTLVILPERGAAIAATATARAERASHPCLAVGEWLRQNVATDTAIAYDHYTYVPPAFANVVDTWGMSEATVVQRDARVVITTERIRERYNSGIDPDSWRHGKEQFLASSNFYRDLERGALPAYTLAHEVPGCHGTRIYWRRPTAGEPP